MGNKRSKTDFKKVGVRIKKLREKKGWSQEEYAKMIGATQQTISAIERGTTKLGLNMLQDIAFSFDVGLDYIMAGNAPKTKSYLRDDMQDKLNQCTDGQESILVELFFDNAKTVMKVKI